MDLHLAEEAVTANGEPRGAVAARLAHGDEFFGWQLGDRVVSYGWATYRDRMLGPIRLAEASGRTFVYDFHTLEEYRGRKLYPSLLLAMRFILGGEGATEFIIDVDARNTPSIKGIQNGGFVPVAQVGYLTFFTRWICFGTQTMLHRAITPLFLPARPNQLPCRKPTT